MLMLILKLDLLQKKGKELIIKELKRFKRSIKSLRVKGILNQITRKYQKNIMTIKRKE